MNKSIIEDLLRYFDLLNKLTLKSGTKRTARAQSPDRIPVVLSSDGKYFRYVSICGMSILSNTDSFIEFYILCDNVSGNEKNVVEQCLTKISNNFSLKFVDTSAAQSFPQIKKLERTHITISTCNRLLIPILLPHLQRAIYLDVDLLLIGDISNLWRENLEGKVFGAVPLIVYRESVVQHFREISHVGNASENLIYKYFNSGVMLIDYDAWRREIGSNELIVRDLTNRLCDLNPQGTPDEAVLNNYAFHNGGYKELAHKYNCLLPYFSYKELKKRKKLSRNKQRILDDYEKNIHSLGVEDAVEPGNIHVIHYLGPDKPWNSISGKRFPMEVLPHLEDYWLYVKNTPYFREMRTDMIAANLEFLTKENEQIKTVIMDFVTKENEQIKMVIKSMCQLPKLKRRLLLTRLKFLFSFGERRAKLNEIKKELERTIREEESLLANY